MRVVLIFLAGGVTIAALRIIFALKTAHSARKELDGTKSAAASADRAVSSSGTAHALPGAGALQDQQTSREEKNVPPQHRWSSSGRRCSWRHSHRGRSAFACFHEH